MRFPPPLLNRENHRFWCRGYPAPPPQIFYWRKIYCDFRPPLKNFFLLFLPYYWLWFAFLIDWQLKELLWQWVPLLIKKITHVTSTVPLFTPFSPLLLCCFFCWIPTTTNVIFWFLFCCFAFLCCVFERLWSHVQDGVAVRGGRAGLTCPTQGAAQLPSRPEDTLQARTLGTVQRFCKTVTLFLVSGWQEGDSGRETDRTEE